MAEFCHFIGAFMFQKMAEFCPCRGVFQRQTPMIVIGSVCGPMRCKKGNFADGTMPLVLHMHQCEFPVGSPYDLVYVNLWMC